MNALSPLDGLPSNYDVNHDTLAEPDRSKKSPPQNPSLDSTNLISHQNALETLPLATQATTNKSQSIEHTLSGRARGIGDWPAPIWNSEPREDVWHDTTQRMVGVNLNHVTYLPEVWKSPHNEQKTSDSASQVEEAKWVHGTDPSINSTESACSTLPTEPSSPVSQPISMHRNKNLSRMENTVRIGCHNSSQDFARYSSSVPEPFKMPIPISKSSRTSTQPLATAYQCELCSMGFTLRKDRNRHVANKHGDGPQFLCPVRSCSLASRGFPRKDKAVRHIKTRHSEYGDIEPIKISEDSRSQDTQSRRSSIVYAHLNSSRSVISSSFASFQGERSPSETNSYGSPLLALTEPEPDISLKGFGNHFLETDKISMENFDQHRRFDYQYSDLSTDIDKMSFQWDKDMGHNYLDQGPYPKSLDDLDNLNDTTSASDIAGLMQDFTESQSGDEITFPVKIRSSQAGILDESEPKRLSLSARNHTL